ncbi:MAG TPA: M3 family metallopeptidase, partial [Soehngenia sp.]|nr:M3 family metallopeptidase [Soehngenia sp.]
LSDTYKELNKFYYGNEIVIDDLIAVEWARIPHFYYNFYVYQYATGFCAAVTLATNIKNKVEGSLEKYLDFLRSGDSDYPINVLKKAGVDMTSVEPLYKALDIFKDLVTDFGKLL